MSRGDPVDGIGIVGYEHAPSCQLMTKSYRPGSGCQRNLRQLSSPFGEDPRRQHDRAPESLVRRGEEGGEDLAAARVEYRQTGAAESVGVLSEGAAESVKRARPTHGQPGAGAEPAGGGDPDPDPGERAGPQANGDRTNGSPGPGGLRRPLHLGQQGGRVARSAIRPQTEHGLVQHLTAARRADRGVLGRRVEADDDPLGAVPASQC